MMMRSLRKSLLLPMIVATAYSAVMPASRQRAPGPNTAAQSAAGRTAYQTNCASCHLPTLAGQGDVPGLTGSAFIENWGRRTTQDLFSFIQLTMPPGRAGVLTAQEYINIVAYILEAHGLHAGNQSLTATTSEPIGAGTAAAAPSPAQAAAAARPAAPAAPPGITIAGEVKNYVPVTDAMLRNPDAGDWLMIRRDYHATNFSPLNQVTRDNVKDRKSVV